MKKAKLRCSALCVDYRCDKVAGYERDGWPVCWQHAKNQKFRPHPTAVRIDVINFAPPGGVEHGRWYFTEVV